MSGVIKKQTINVFQKVCKRGFLALHFHIPCFIEKQKLQSYGRNEDNITMDLRERALAKLTKYH